VTAVTFLKCRNQINCWERAMALVLDGLTNNFPGSKPEPTLKTWPVATAPGGAIPREAHSAPIVRALSGITAIFRTGGRTKLIGSNRVGKTKLLRADLRYLRAVARLGLHREPDHHHLDLSIGAFS
jgi:hypothetical protein